MLFRLKQRNQAWAKPVLSVSKRLSSLTDRELKESSASLRGRLKERQQVLRDAAQRCEIFGHACEAIRRVFGFELHPVQIEAAQAAANGTSIEMQTGEGKTIVSALIAYFHSCFGCVHLATTNAYLAGRDFESLQPVFDLLSTSVGLISHQQNSTEKRHSYQCDITYGPGHQFGFDYLADQITLRECNANQLGASTMISINGVSSDESLLQRGYFQTMIVDEADSVMIDEALTPLVLSGLSTQPHDFHPYPIAQNTAEKLEEKEHYLIDQLQKKIHLTQQGMNKIHVGLDRVTAKMDIVRPWSKYIENAIHAVHFLKRDEHYVVQDDKVKIVDQFTGRIFDDRQWQNGLHQAICAKEKIQVQQPTEILARISRQRYFQRYEQIVGLSGTMDSVQAELHRVYRSRLAIVPANKSSRRSWAQSRFFETEEAKFDAIAAEVKARHKTGQPVLIGTRTIKQSHICKDLLDAQGLDAILLNGVQDQEEAEVVSQAGRVGNITIATNMAGRGTDIKLDHSALKRGGLHVIGTEHNFSQRIDRQLIGRCARQGQPGSAQFFASSEDELFWEDDRLALRIKLRSTNTGECYDRRAITYVMQLQRLKESNAIKVRQAQMEADQWHNSIRETLTKEAIRWSI